MSEMIGRRDVLRSIACGGAGVLLKTRKVSARDSEIIVAGKPVELALSAISQHTVRISITALTNSKPIPDDPSLVRQAWAPAKVRFTTLPQRPNTNLGNLVVRLSGEPLTIRLEDKAGRLVQKLRFDQSTGQLSFSLGGGPVLGLGEGGPQFDRRGRGIKCETDKGAIACERTGDARPFRG